MFVTTNMFTPYIDHSKERQLMKALDANNHSYGEGAIQFASAGLKKIEREKGNVFAKIYHGT